jgi:Lrp/AsnC family leucine-responsive transcriptional regulator
MIDLDDIDIQILKLLQDDGRKKLNALAEEVSLSIPSVRERLKKIENQGLITAYHALIDHKKIGLDITAFVRINIRGSAYYEHLIALIRDLEEVQELHSITGDGSHLIKVRTKNTSTLEQLLSKIQKCPGLEYTSTSIVLSTLKESPNLPLNNLMKSIHIEDESLKKSKQKILFEEE